MRPAAEKPELAPLDWTRLSDDPNNPVAKQAVRAYLRSVRQVHTSMRLLEFIESLVKDKTVLDIGVAEHSLRYVERPEWRHGRIARLARRCVGIDILEELVRELNGRGFNVVCVDATSEQDIGDRFEVAFIGDVLEHVNDPTRLLRFAARHLAPGGRIFASTPNPFSRKWYKRFRGDGTAIANLDHVAWITPTQAMEIARRAGIRLAAYHLVKHYSAAQLAWHRVVWRFSPLEWSFPDFVYEFA